MGARIEFKFFANRGRPEGFRRESFESHALAHKEKPLREFLVAIMEQERDDDLNELSSSKRPVVEVLKDKESELQLGADFRHVLNSLSNVVADKSTADDKDQVRLSSLVTGRRTLHVSGCPQFFLTDWFIEMTLIN